MEQFVAWIVAFIISVSPPGRNSYVPDARETREEAVARYESIARDIVTVVTEEEPLFSGPTGRIRTASVIMSIMFFESGFRRDVDLGIGKLAKGDNGNSVCMMQLNIGKGRTFAWNTVKNRPSLPADPADEVVQGWTQQEISADRKKCIRAGYRIMRISFGSGRGLPSLDKLRVYASGSVNGGVKESHARMGMALRYYSANRPTFKDGDVILPAAPIDPILPDAPTKEHPGPEKMAPFRLEMPELFKPQPWAMAPYQYALTSY